MSFKPTRLKHIHIIVSTDKNTGVEVGISFSESFQPELNLGLYLQAVHLLSCKEA